MHPFMPRYKRKSKRILIVLPFEQDDAQATQDDWGSLRVFYGEGRSYRDIGQIPSRIYMLYSKLCGVISMDEVKTEVTEKADNANISYIERNGRTFMIIEHFSDDQSYMDIVKNALRREAEST